MISTYQRGQSIESFFRSFAKPAGSDFILYRDEFTRAVQTLGVDWSGNSTKVNELFDQLDLAVHQGLYARSISVTDLGESVFLNAAHTVDDLVGMALVNLHRALKA